MGCFPARVHCVAHELQHINTFKHPALKARTSQMRSLQR